MSRRGKAIAMCALLVPGTLLIGCSKSEPTVVTTPDTAGGRQDAAGADGSKAKGSSVVDTSVQAAPAGVKTGLEGGKKE